MSRIQIRQKIKTAVLGLAIVLGVLVNADRGEPVQMRGAVPDPVNQQHAANAPAYPEAVLIRMRAGSHPVVLRVVGVAVHRTCSDGSRAI